jgi:hypothetical protein
VIVYWCDLTAKTRPPRLSTTGTSPAVMCGANWNRSIGRRIRATTDPHTRCGPRSCMIMTVCHLRRSSSSVGSRCRCRRKEGLDPRQTDHPGQTRRRLNAGMRRDNRTLTRRPQRVPSCRARRVPEAPAEGGIHGIPAPSAVCKTTKEPRQYSRNAHRAAQSVKHLCGSSCGRGWTRLSIGSSPSTSGRLPTPFPPVGRTIHTC